MKQEFFTPEFLYADLNMCGIEYVLENYSIDLESVFQRPAYSDGYTPPLHLPSFRVIGVNPWYLRGNTYKTCFLVLIHSTVVKLFSDHICNTWDYVYYKSSDIVK